VTEDSKPSDVTAAAHDGESPASAPISTADLPAKPLPLVDAVVVGVFFPARAAVATQGVALRRMWGVHVFGVALGVLVIAAIVAAAGLETLSAASLFREMSMLGERCVGEFMSYPGESFLILMALVLGVEAAFAVAAFVFMPAGARDEPIRASYAHALRQLWLSTPRIVMVIVVTGAVVTTLARVNRAWTQAHPEPVWPDEPTQPNRSAYADQDAFDQAMLEYDDAMLVFHEATGAYWAEYGSWRRAKPWYIRDFQVLVMSAVAVGLLWYVLTLLRALSAPRAVAPVDRPPLCDRCGYNLTAAEIDGRCPECGVPVVVSLGSHVRPGAPWVHRGRIGAVRAFADTAWSAMRHPTEFGRILQAGHARRDDLRFAGCLYPVIFLVGALMIVISMAAQMDADEFMENLHFVCTMPVIFGIMCVIGAIGFCLFGALLAGVGQSTGTGRNLLPIASQMSFYLIGFLTMWEIFGGVTSLIAAWLEHIGIFEWLESTIGFDEGFWAFVAWSIPNAVWAVAFLVFVSQATVAARFANK